MTQFVQPNRQLLVSIVGIATAILTGIILGLIEVYTGLALYSFTVWLIIPIGALIAGFGAATGFYFGTTYFQQKPVGGVFLNIAIASISAFFIVHYVPYFLMEINGVRVKDAISFWQYLDIDIRNTSVSLVRAPSASTGSLGSLWGYPYTLIQLLGFSFGGIGVFFWLSSIPFCNKCSRYLKTIYQKDKYISDGASLIESLQSIKSLISNNEFDRAISLHADNIGVNEKPGHHLRAKLITRTCPGCGINHFNFNISKLEKDSWSNVRETEISLFTNQSLPTNR
jgi:hypothetical protein